MKPYPTYPCDPLQRVPLLEQPAPVRGSRRRPVREEWELAVARRRAERAAKEQK